MKSRNYYYHLLEIDKFKNKIKPASKQLHSLRYSILQRPLYIAKCYLTYLVLLWSM